MRPAYLFVMATGGLLVFGYANAGQAINKAGALAHSDGRAGVSVSFWCVI
jgi:hypothetical protein